MRQAPSLPPPPPPPPMRAQPHRPQIAIAQAQSGAAKPFGMPVVVLADKDKAQMDQEVGGLWWPAGVSGGSIWATDA
jgi:hypothetical protein